MKLAHEIKRFTKLPFAIKREAAARHISYTPALDLYSQGESRSEARANLREAIVLFLESCHRRGTLEQVLRDCGFEPS